MPFQLLTILPKHAVDADSGRYSRLKFKSRNILASRLLTILVKKLSRHTISFPVFAIGAIFATSVWAQQVSELPNRHSENLQSCLLDGVQSSAAKINWRSTRTLEDLENCAFAMASKLRNAEALNEWLQENGFKAKSPRDVPKSVMRLYDISTEGSRLSGTISKGKIPLRLGLIDRFVVHSLSIGILLDADNNPVVVQATFTQT